MKNKFKNVFESEKPLIGVVRLLPLLGYKSFNSIERIIKVALSDIKKLENAKFDGVLVDNHAHPHVIKAKKEHIASFSVVMAVLVKLSKIPLGVQYLIDDPEASLATAKATGAKFIRTDFFVDKVITKYGLHNPDPKKIIAYRELISAEDVLVFADIQVKYSQQVEQKSIEQSAREAVGKGADAIIVTGNRTGQQPLISDLKKVKETVKVFPVLVGSGLNAHNCSDLLKVADGALVGTAIRNGSRIGYKKACLIKGQLSKI